MANVLKLLRNNSLFATREAALAGIQSKAATLSDGEMWVATYGTSPNAKSILAVKRDWGVTTFDLEAIVSEIEENVFKYKMVALSAEEIATLQDAANIKEAYKVVAYQGQEGEQTVYTQVGVPVKIYKDSSLKESYLGSDSDTVNTSTGVVTKYVYELISNPSTKITAAEYEAMTTEQKALYKEIDSQSLNFVYQLADGTYEIVKVDVSKFLAQSEFGNGLQVDGNGVVSVKIDSTSADAEGFISVGADGIKISGVQDAIEQSVGNVVGELDATVKGSLDANDDTKVETGKHVGVKIVQEDGLLTSVVVVEDDIPSASNIENIELVISSALNDLETRKANKSDLDILTGDVLESVAEGNGISVTTKTNKSQTISINLDTTHDSIPGSANVLSLSSDGLYLSETVDCGTY